MTRLEAQKILEDGSHLSVGEHIDFTHSLHGNEWAFKLIREEERYEPFRYKLEGEGGKYGTWLRRYHSIEKALLHIVNNLNENSNIKNSYNTLEEWLRQRM